MAARKTTSNPTAAEALNDLISFDYAGHTYKLAPSSAWSTEALERFEDGKIITFLREVLSAADFRAMKAACPQVSDLEGFMTAVQEAIGIAGN
ncbi:MULTISPECIES: hypothetical protein [Bacteria]|uniref:hypothetical protein n=1 Tax=Bacteria TaxID=2 RepID=UPI003C7AB59D